MKGLKLKEQCSQTKDILFIVNKCQFILNGYTCIKMTVTKLFPQNLTLWCSNEDKYSSGQKKFRFSTHTTAVERVNHCHIEPVLPQYRDRRTTVARPHHLTQNGAVSVKIAVLRFTVMPYTD